MASFKVKEEGESPSFGLFDIVNNITSGRTELIEEQLAEYNPFMVNKALSQYKDTVLFANELNMYPELDSYLQYSFYFHIIAKKKRYAKWNKTMDDVELIEKIQRVYGYSYTKAKEVSPLLKTHEPYLDALLSEGGKMAKNNKR